MQNPEDMAAGWRLGALVVIEGDGATAIRPAAFVFVAPSVLAWVEPSYADPAGAASPAVHMRAGAVEVVGEGLHWKGSTETITVLPYEPEVDADLVGDALAWWARHVVENKVDLEAERARVRALAFTDG